MNTEKPQNHDSDSGDTERGEQAEERFDRPHEVEKEKAKEVKKVDDQQHSDPEGTPSDTDCEKKEKRKQEETAQSSGEQEQAREDEMSEPEEEKQWEEVDGDVSFDEEMEKQVQDQIKSEISEQDFTSLRLSLFNVSCLFYLVMALLSFWIMRKQEIFKEVVLTFRMTTPVEILIGGGIAGAVVLAGMGLYRWTEWAKGLEEKFAPYMNVYAYIQIPLVALLSGIGEEFLFRGVLQHAIGLWPAAILFAAVHVPWEKEMIPWPIFALIMGVVFGYFVKWTGSLWGPITAHFLINMINIYLIKSRNPMDRDEIMEHFVPPELR